MADREAECQQVVKDFVELLKRYTDGKKTIQRFLEGGVLTRGGSNRLKSAAGALNAVTEIFPKLVEKHDDWINSTVEDIHSAELEPKELKVELVDLMDSEHTILISAARVKFLEFTKENPDIDLALTFLDQENNKIVEKRGVEFLLRRMDQVSRQIEHSMGSMEVEVQAQDSRPASEFSARVTKMGLDLDSGIWAQLIKEMFQLDGASKEFLRCEGWAKAQWDKLEQLKGAVEALRLKQDPLSKLAVDHVSAPGGSKCGAASMIHLKKVDPPSFDGEIIEWPEFERKWQAQVHSVGLVQDAELDRLKDSLPREGKNLLYTVTDLAEAWVILRAHYGDHGLIAEALKARLKGLKVMAKEGFNRVIQIRNEVKQLVARLEQVGHAQALIYDTQFRGCVLRLLPAPEQRDWNSFNKNKHPHLWLAFMDFIEVIYANALSARIEHATIAASLGEEVKQKCAWCQRVGHVEAECRVKVAGKPEVYIHHAELVGGEPDPQQQAKDALKARVGRCPLCSSPHTWNRPNKKDWPSSRLCACPEFRKLAVVDRARKVQELGACPQCTCWDHARDNCFIKTPVCGADMGAGSKCQGKHNFYLHDSGNTYCATTSLTTPACADTLMMVQDLPIGKSVARTMYDTACNRILVTHRYASEAKLHSAPITYQLKVVGQGWETKKGLMYEFWLRDRAGEEKKVWGYGIEEITEVVDPVDLSPLRRVFPHLPEQAFRSLSRKPVDVLIGSNYASVHPRSTNDVRDEVGELRVVRSRYGEQEWIITGSHPLLMSSNMSITQPAKEMSCILNRIVIRPSLEMDFWEGENLGVQTPRRCQRCEDCGSKGECSDPSLARSVKDEQELVMLKGSIRLDTEKQELMVSYPFLKNPECLPDNRHVVTKMADRLWTQLTKSGLLEQYHREFQGYLSRGAVVRVSEQEIKEWDGPTNYISHHGVLKNSASTPVRIVANSSLNNCGNSLNTCLPKGPNSLCDMMSILIRFRCREQGMSLDLSKAYQTVKTTVVEKHLRRIVWRMNKDEPWQVFAFDKMQFGDKPAACLLELGINLVADAGEPLDRAAAERLKKDRYVDDLVSGGSGEELDRFIGQKNPEGEYSGTLAQILIKGGFKIKSIARSGVIDPGASELLGGKVLGYIWNTKEDMMGVSTQVNLSAKKRGVRSGSSLGLGDLDSLRQIKMTRRVLLAFTMGQYDPLGISAPQVIKYKLAMKDLILYQDSETGKKLGWDDPVPQGYTDHWVQLIEDAVKQGQVLFQRAAKPHNAIGDPCIAGFWDGSSRAFAASIYIIWRVLVEDPEFGLTKEKIEVTLLCAKARVTPAKGLTVPRSEMSGLTLCARLTASAVRAIPQQVDTVTWIGDSECVISALDKTNTALAPYFHNRVMEVSEHMQEISQRCLTMEKVQHCKSADNAADLATRDKATLQDLEPDAAWQRGPDFLRWPRSLWRVSRDFIRRELPGEDLRVGQVFLGATEVRQIETSAFRVIPELLMYSENLEKVVRILARVQRGWKRRAETGQKLDKDNPDDMVVMREGLTALEVTAAFRTVLIAGMIETKRAWKRGDLDNLLPRLEQGLIVTQGRVGEKGLQSLLGVDRLVLLMPQSRTAYLVMRGAHHGDGGLAHRGVLDTLSRSRSVAWIIRGKTLAKRIRRNCLVCRRKDRDMSAQRMAQIQPDQLQVCRPWTNLSLDYAGPFMIKGIVNTRAKKKVWVGVYVCRNTKAVCFTLLPGYDTSAFLLQHHKFVAEHGAPSKVVADRGTSLVKAGQELAKAESPAAWDWARIISENSVSSWEFVPVGCAWRAGLAESQVKALKQSLGLAMYDNDLDYAEFSVLLSRIACMINSRPLDIAREGQNTSDDGDLQPITPNQLLLGRSSNLQTPQDYQEETNANRRMMYVQELEEVWWRNWMERVFPSLMSYNRWSQSSRNLQVGDVVLIKFPRIKKAVFTLGRISEVFPDQDGLTRTVRVEFRQRVSREARNKCRNSVRNELMGVQRLCCILPVEEQLLTSSERASDNQPGVSDNQPERS